MLKQNTFWMRSLCHRWSLLSLLRAETATQSTRVVGGCAILEMIWNVTEHYHTSSFASCKRHNLRPMFCNWCGPFWARLDPWVKMDLWIVFEEKWGKAAWENTWRQNATSSSPGLAGAADLDIFDLESARRMVSTYYLLLNECDVSGRPNHNAELRVTGHPIADYPTCSFRPFPVCVVARLRDSSRCWLVSPAKRNFVLDLSVAHSWCFVFELDKKKSNKEIKLSRRKQPRDTNRKPSFTQE